LGQNLAVGTSNADQFLDAFTELEKLLRNRLKGQKGLSFAGMVERAATADPAIRRFETDLKELADLRNAIVHERSDGHPIADPYPTTVQWIERLVRLIKAPPRVDTVAAHSVETCRPDDTVGFATGRMLAGAFSQLPVLSGRGIVALLTAETIARWVGASLQGDLGLIEEVTVEEVLAFTEDPHHHWEVTARDRTAFEALARFDYYATRGWSLDALLITANGKPTEAVLGILTTFDIPKLHELIAA
jgi:predicted transcriptional regulator